MDWRLLEAAITARTRAIMPVHLYGHAVEMQPIMDIAHTHNLRIIEDASQAHGATYMGQRVGSFGDIGCFSLYYSKNLGAFAEAGICTTNDAALADRMRMFRDHGSREKYQHEVMGVNARLDELQAAVLNIKMPYIEQWNATRQAHAKAYNEQLRDFVEAVPVVKPWGTHVYCYYVIRVSERDAFRLAMEQEGIGTTIHYPIPIHLQRAAVHYGYSHGSLPHTEALAKRIISLPMYPEMTEEQRQLVVNAVKKHVVPSVSKVS